MKRQNYGREKSWYLSCLALFMVSRSLASGSSSYFDRNLSSKGFRRLCKMIRSNETQILLAGTGPTKVFNFQAMMHLVLGAVMHNTITKPLTMLKRSNISGSDFLRFQASNSSTFFHRFYAQKNINQPLPYIYIYIIYRYIHRKCECLT